jgi:glycosyltransferase involved in cell wall biosynthesis
MISIIMPLYNRGWCVAGCIESIGLGPAGAELIIVDDGSKDDSIPRAKQALARLDQFANVTLIEQGNAGPSTARNRAAAAAKGEWLVFLDSDDLWFPWTLPTLFQIFSSVPSEVDLVFLQGRNFAETSELGGILPADAITQAHPSFVDAVRAVPAMRYGACNAAIRRAVFAGLDGFAAELRCMEDTDLFLRVPGAVMTIAAPVLAALRRSGHESLSGNVKEVIKGFHWLLTKAAEGRYVGRPEAIRSFLAGSCAYSIRTAFAAGYPAQAYRMYLRNMRLLANSRTRKHLVRLPLTPLLHALKPAVYPYRSRPG